MATSRCGRLRHIFDSPELGPRLKLRLYIAAVCSLLTYGCETWQLTPQTMQKINGANANMPSRVTGNSVYVESRPTTASFDLVKDIRTRRLKWLGQILRGDKDRILFDAVRHQHEYCISGHLLMDVPPHNDFDELVNMAKDKTFWSTLRHDIPSHLRKSTIYTE